MKKYYYDKTSSINGIEADHFLEKNHLKIMTAILFLFIQKMTKFHK